MAQPEFVPSPPATELLVGEQIPPAKRWLADRPGEVVTGGGQPEGPGFGAIGPDQGYALRLARAFTDRVELVQGEHKRDVVAGCVAVAMRRSSLFGRGPVIYDLDLAFSVWGFLGGAPTELLRQRPALFEEAAVNYWTRRRIVDAVSESALRLTPAAARAGLANWSGLLQL